jgi:hypothetical protein
MRSPLFSNLPQWAVCCRSRFAAVASAVYASPPFLATIAETRQLSKRGRRALAPPFEVSAASPTSRESVASARCTCAFLEGCSLLPAHSVRRRGGQWQLPPKTIGSSLKLRMFFSPVVLHRQMLARLSASFAMPVRLGRTWRRQLNRFHHFPGLCGYSFHVRALERRRS